MCAQMPKGKCRNCGMHSPAIKRQGATRLFKLWPSRKALLANMKLGRTVRGVLDDADADGVGGPGGEGGRVGWVVLRL